MKINPRAWVLAFMILWLTLCARTGVAQMAESAPVQPTEAVTVDARQTEAGRQVQAAMEAPLPPAPAQPSAVTAAQPGSWLGRNLMAILLILILVGIVVMIFRIPEASAYGHQVPLARGAPILTDATLFSPKKNPFK